jgi:hypothetical protein
LLGQARATSGEAALPARTARALLGLGLFSLAVMQPPLALFGFTAVPGDLLFAGLFALALIMALLGQLRPIVDRAYWFIGAYFVAMLASSLVSLSPAPAAAKLATQAYLLALPLLLCSMVRDERHLRSALRWWLA